MFTKDADFVRLLESHGPPPQIVWITIGTSSTAELVRIVREHWRWAADHLTAGEPLVEIGRRTA